MVPENWKARKEMLRHLARLEAEGKGPPSVRELGEAVGFRSSQTAYKHLKKLEEAGYVGRRDGRARGIMLTEKGWEAAGEMPLMGRIAAGRGLEAVTVEDEAYSLAAELVGSRLGRRRYLLALIGDGEEVTVKRLYREKNEAGDLLRLKPENGDHQDLVIPAQDVKIQGRVVYVVHPPRGRR